VRRLLGSKPIEERHTARRVRRSERNRNGAAGCGLRPNRREASRC
jgi:hypothetical protein